MMFPLDPITQYDVSILSERSAAGPKRSRWKRRLLCREELLLSRPTRPAATSDLCWLPPADRKRNGRGTATSWTDGRNDHFLGATGQSGATWWLAEQLLLCLIDCFLVFLDVTSHYNDGDGDGETLKCCGGGGCFTSFFSAARQQLTVRLCLSAFFKLVDRFCFLERAFLPLSASGTTTTTTTTMTTNFSFRGPCKLCRFCSRPPARPPLAHFSTQP